MTVVFLVREIFDGVQSRAYASQILETKDRGMVCTLEESWAYRKLRVLSFASVTSTRKRELCFHLFYRSRDEVVLEPLSKESVFVA